MTLWSPFTTHTNTALPSQVCSAVFEPVSPSVTGRVVSLKEADSRGFALFAALQVPYKDSLFYVRLFETLSTPEAVLLIFR